MTIVITRNRNENHPRKTKHTKILQTQLKQRLHQEQHSLALSKLRKHEEESRTVNVDNSNHSVCFAVFMSFAVFDGIIEESNHGNRWSKLSDLQPGWRETRNFLEAAHLVAPYDIIDSSTGLLPLTSSEFL